MFAHLRKNLHGNVDAFEGTHGGLKRAGEGRDEDHLGRGAEEGARGRGARASASVVVVALVGRFGGEDAARARDDGAVELRHLAPAELRELMLSRRS